MLEKISNMIIDQLGLKRGTIITEASSFKSDLRADSFELMQLVVALEQEYGIEIDDSELEGFATVGDVMAYIKSQGIDLESK